MTKRIFLGVKIPVEEKLLNVLNEIKTTLKNDYIKWVEINNLHLTLLFLGDVHEEIIPDIISKLKIIENKVSNFKITFKNIGVFKNVYHPRVIWIGIEPIEEMQELKAEIDELITKTGLNIKSEEKFHPHLTIGRPKNIKDPSKLKLLIDDYEGVILQEVDITKFQLFESKLTPKGPIYSVIQDYLLVN
ncbi:MAG: RNA 2',3'-cyclic phosphodiesterase [Bacteroidales bacterium]|nr:RNA 2',3'-cyclic phosphodiesterase [Bacteroidales bacterium]